MEKQYPQLQNQEYSLAVENMTLHLLIRAHEKSGDTVSPTELTRLALHTHTFAELLVCRSQTLLLNTEEGILELQPEEGVIIPPGVPHTSLLPLNNRIWVGIPFFCTPSVGRGTMDLYSLIAPFCSGSRIRLLRNFSGLSERVRIILEESDSRWPISSVLMLLQLLTELAQHTLPEPGGLCHTNTAADSETLRMNKLDYILNTEFMENITAQDIADALFISVRHLSRIVERRYGTTLHRVLTDMRITRAEKLLRTTDMSAEKIALIVGFGSKAGFWREFSRKYGVTPGEYRRMEKEENRKTSEAHFSE